MNDNSDQIKQEEITVFTFEEVIQSINIDFLKDAKDFYESLENYEACGVIRDRIKELKDNNNEIEIFDFSAK